MISVDEALRAVLRVAEQRKPTPVALALPDALGLVLAEDIRAPDPLPPYRASIKVSSPFPSLPLSLSLFLKI